MQKARLAPGLFRIRGLVAMAGHGRPTQRLPAKQFAGFGGNHISR